MRGDGDEQKPVAGGEAFEATGSEWKSMKAKEAKGNGEELRAPGTRDVRARTEAVAKTCGRGSRGLALS